MRARLPILVLALLMIAGLFFVLTRSGSTEGGSRSGNGSSDAAELSLALRELREDNERLLERLAALEERQLLLENASSVRVPERRSLELDEPSGAPTEEEVTELVAALRDLSQSPPAELQALVLGVLEEKEAREEQERTLMREQMRETRMDERMERLIAELGLADYQSKEMRTILTDAEQRRSEFFMTMQENGGFMDRDLMREGMREMRSDTEEQLTELLTPDQYARYEELEGDRGFGGGRGGFGRERGGGGGRSDGGAGAGGSGGGGGRRGR